MKLIDRETYLNRLISIKGEATSRTFKVEFVYPQVFESLNQIKLELYDYVNWYNNSRLHSSLGYLSPIAYKNLHLKKVV